MANLQNNIDCSIIVLNYFGEKVISKTIDSLLHQSFPKSKYEIIIVDNHSQDKSKQIIDQLAKLHPQIKTLYLSQNLGFAQGNNRGIEIARGKYVALLNNDCFVEKNWLKNLYQTISSHPKIFAVTSKVKLYPYYFPLTIIQNQTDIILKVKITNSSLLNYSSIPSLEIPFNTNQQNYTLNIPYDQLFDKSISFTITFTSPPSAKIISQIKDNPFLSHISTKSNHLQVTLDCHHPLVSKNSFQKIQNAGSLVFNDGYGRDIGAQVKYMQQDYETDQGQFNTVRPVYAICGAAVMFSTKILAKIGTFDDNLFMYYEDIEISERARLHGYNLLYCPTAIAHHLHALSSREWSNFFLFNVERNRLIHVFYHFPFKVFLVEFTKFSIKALLYLSKEQQTTYIKIVINIIKNSIPLYLRRRHYRQMYPTKAVLLNYQNIIRGKWYEE